MRSSIILLLMFVSCFNDDDQTRFTLNGVEGMVQQPIFCYTEQGPVFKIALKESIGVRGGEDLRYIGAVNLKEDMQTTGVEIIFDIEQATIEDIQGPCATLYDLHFFFRVTNVKIKEP